MNIETTTHDIDIAKIWEHKTQEFLKAFQNKEYFEAVFNYLGPLLVQQGVKPFISKEMVEADPALEDYYNNYLFRISRDEFPIDYFKYGTAFYDMSTSCPVNLWDVGRRDFLKLFALQIDYYLERPLVEMIGFLEYQLVESFGSEEPRFWDFLLELTRQSFFNIEEKTKDRLQLWVAIKKQGRDAQLESSRKSLADVNHEALGVSANETSLTTNNARSKDVAENSAVTTGSTLVERASIETPITQSTGPVSIPGSMTLPQVQHFFSFLYKEKNDLGQPLLKQEDVEEIFRNGMIMPEVPKAEKFKINLTSRYPRKVVDCYVYHFYAAYNIKAKGDILKFLGSYINLYEDALDPFKLKTIKGNLTAEKPKNVKIKLAEYLPA